MPTYIILGNFTQKGIESIKDGPARLDDAKQAARAAGGEIKAYYLVKGQYDFVAVVEAPDEATYNRVLLSVASRGYFRSETLPAIREDEYRSLIAGLP
jgi:uncharacterized protein with GYD domain